MRKDQSPLSYYDQVAITRRQINILILKKRRDMMMQNETDLKNWLILASADDHDYQSLSDSLDKLIKNASMSPCDLIMNCLEVMAGIENKCLSA